MSAGKSTGKSATTRSTPSPARPGTAVQTKGQHRAEEILSAARSVLVEEGYAALSTRKVAQRVGIRQSNVQYYFPAKTDLVRALFERSTATNMEQLSRRMAQRRMTPKQRLTWTIDLFLRSHQSLDQQVFLRELWALAAHDSEVAAVMNGFYERWVDLATENLLEINPKLGLRRAQRRALLIVSLVDGLSLFHGAAGIDHAAVRGIEREVRELVARLVLEAPTSP
jgi:AcrR family transcriptional regulator